MEDVRIGRESVGATYTVTATTGTRQLLLPDNPDRIAFTVAGDNLGVAFIMPQNATDTAAGWQVNTTIGQCYFGQEFFGKLIQGAWFCRARSGSVTLQIVEVLLQRK